MIFWHSCQSREKRGGGLIICMDANEDIYWKMIGKSLVRSHGLIMIEAVGNYTGQQLGATFSRGKKPIDGFCVTSDAQVIGVCVMPACYGVGDHCLFVVDFLISSLVGNLPLKISSEGDG